MTRPRTAEIDVRQVPLADCDWVLYQPCGCPRGVTVARGVRDEDAAWRQFFDSWKQIAKAIQAGHRIELMTHGRYSAEVYPQMLPSWECPHGEAPEPRPAGQGSLLDLIASPAPEKTSAKEK